MKESSQITTTTNAHLRILASLMLWYLDILLSFRWSVISWWSGRSGSVGTKDNLLAAIERVCSCAKNVKIPQSNPLSGFIESYHLDRWMPLPLQFLFCCSQLTKMWVSVAPQNYNWPIDRSYCDLIPIYPVFPVLIGEKKIL